MKNVDPPIDKRVYYKNRATQQKGYAVVRAGAEMLKLDGIVPEMIIRLDTSVWYVDREHRPINRIHAASVAFEADRRLCTLLCMHAEAKRKWVDLSASDKMVLVEDGPPGPAIRRKLWRANMAALEEISS